MHLQDVCNFYPSPALHNDNDERRPMIMMMTTRVIIIICRASYLEHAIYDNEKKSLGLHVQRSTSVTDSSQII